MDAEQDAPSEEKPARNMNKLFSRTEPSFADETTPITPFGAETDHTDLMDEVTTGDLSEILPPKPKSRSVLDDNAKGKTPSYQRPTNINLPSPGSALAKDNFDRSPGKEQKKKGFLGGIFRKKK